MANLTPLLAPTAGEEDREPVDRSVEESEAQLVDAEDGVSKKEDGSNAKNKKYALVVVVLVLLMVRFLPRICKDDSAELSRMREETYLYHHFPRFDRNVFVAHLGHTISETTAESIEVYRCEARRDPNTNEGKTFRACLFKMPSSPETEQQQQHPELPRHPKPDSFLFTVRNPVDRVLAIYADAHPRSCPDPSHFFRKPWGCKMKAFQWYDKGSKEYRFFHQCFPHTNDPEPMVRQAVGLADEDLGDCPRMAHRFILGGYQELAPDLSYNYQHYVPRALLWNGQKPEVQQNDTEILVVRAEHETKDWDFLERLIGIKANRMDNANTIQVPKISPQAYTQLCCLLKEEIELYQLLLDWAANLPHYAKRESMNQLKLKCGAKSPQVDLDWEAWSDQYCQQGGGPSGRIA